MVIYTKLLVANNEILDAKDITLNLNQNEYNTTSNFTISLDNVAGRHAGEFSINDEIEVYADTTDPATTKIFNGIIDDIKYKGSKQTETLTILGREYGSVLMDVIAGPRIFKDTEVSEIVSAVMSQNISLITTNNVNTTTTTVDKITFSNMSVYDALRQLAEISGFYFYVDTDKDLHFERKETISSGQTIDNDNSKRAEFITTDSDQYTKVTVRGKRQLTTAQSIQTTGTDNTGSVYVLDAKPSNVGVTYSGATNTLLQPGGVINLNDPATENVKFLVDFQGRSVTLTSGTTAGDNTLTNGSVVIIDYQRSTPIISIKQTPSSFPKHRVVTDLNIQDIDEASLKATTILNENKDPKTNGRVEVKGLLDITAGETVIVNLPNHNQINQTYALTRITYEFSTGGNQSENVITINLNRKISDFEDIMKDQILRLRSLESAEADASITSIELGNAETEVEVSTIATTRGIGSGFYFNIPGHDIFNSPSSLLGDMRAGSQVFIDGEEV